MPTTELLPRVDGLISLVFSSAQDNTNQRRRRVSRPELQWEDTNGAAAVAVAVAADPGFAEQMRHLDEELSTWALAALEREFPITSNFQPVVSLHFVKFVSPDSDLKLYHRIASCLYEYTLV